MKTLGFPTILSCMMCMFYISCENAELHDPIKVVTEIESRTIDDCEDCPTEHCCCTIELDDDPNTASLVLCGVYTNETVSNPCGPYSAPGGCSSVPSGTTSPITLIPIFGPRKYFCLPFGGSFRIYNDGNQTASLKMTCQADNTTDPIYTYFRVDMETEVFFEEDGDCTLVLCE